MGTPHDQPIHAFVGTVPATEAVRDTSSPLRSKSNAYAAAMAAVIKEGIEVGGNTAGAGGGGACMHATGREGGGLEK